MKLYPYTLNVNAVRMHFVDMEIWQMGEEQVGYALKENIV